MLVDPCGEEPNDGGQLGTDGGREKAREGEREREGAGQVVEWVCRASWSVFDQQGEQVERGGTAAWPAGRHGAGPVATVEEGGEILR